MRRLALAALVAGCTPSPRETPTVPAPAPPASAVSIEDAGAPSPPTWSGKPETMVVGAIETSDLYQTRTHVVWAEEFMESDTKTIHAVIALDKKTLAKRTVHTLSMRVARTRREMMEQSEAQRRTIFTTDDAVFLERNDHTVRITLDDKAPIRLPSNDDSQCADGAGLYRIDDSNRVTFTPFRQGKSARFPVAIPKEQMLLECQVVSGALYLFLTARPHPQEWTEPQGMVGRVPLRGGAFESITPIDGPGPNASASDGAFAFRARPHADPAFGHILLLEPGKPMRLIAKTTGLANSIAVNRTHVCWDEMQASGPSNILCAARAGGEPALAVGPLDPMTARFLLDDDHLMWIAAGLNRIPVPR